MFLFGIRFGIRTRIQTKSKNEIAWNPNLSKIQTKWCTQLIIGCMTKYFVSKIQNDVWKLNHKITQVQFALRFFNVGIPVGYIWSLFVVFYIHSTHAAWLITIMFYKNKKGVKLNLYIYYFFNVAFVTFALKINLHIIYIVLWLALNSWKRVFKIKNCLLPVGLPMKAIL